MPRIWLQRTAPSLGLRGLIANISEWKQRDRPDVEPPRGHVLHIVQWYRRAFEVGRWEPDIERWEETWLRESGRDERDELKGSSWGLFPEGWRIIDYDRAWRGQGDSLLARYWCWRQTRKARKWMRLEVRATPNVSS